MEQWMKRMADRAADCRELLFLLLSLLFSTALLVFVLLWDEAVLVGTVKVSLLFAPIGAFILSVTRKRE